MQFPRREVYELLTRHYDQIEKMWDDHPYDELYACACTVKEFMLERRIATADDGIETYLAFKGDQRKLLAQVGIGRTTSTPTVRRLAPQRA